MLTHVAGASLYDAWTASFHDDCQQRMCCVHILREVRVLSQEMGLWWVVKLERLVLTMKRATDDARDASMPGFSPPEIADGHARSRVMLDEGYQLHARILPSKGKRGRAWRHLLDRVEMVASLCFLCPFSLFMQ